MAYLIPRDPLEVLRRYRAACARLDPRKDKLTDKLKGEAMQAFTHI